MAEPEREPDINLTETHFGAKAATTDEPQPEPNLEAEPPQEPAPSPAMAPLDGTEQHFYHAAILGQQRAQGAMELALSIIRERRGIPSYVPVGISLDGQVQIGQGGEPA
jgi:hypothetical protein